MADVKSPDKRIIVAAIKNAGRRMLKYKGRSDSYTKSKDFDYGVPADNFAEIVIIRAVNKTGLDCQIISEEAGQIGNRNSKLKVYIDSLDGSVNFSRNIPVFAIGFAIYDDGKPLLGIVYDPSADELFIAEKNRGVTVNGKKIDPKYHSEKILVNLEWFGARGYEKIVNKLKKHKIRARTAGSGVLALCYSMIGRGDAAILIKNRPWDIAPGMVFASELGCTIKQFNGRAVDLGQNEISVIAAPGSLFKKLSKIIY